MWGPLGPWGQGHVSSVSRDSGNLGVRDMQWAGTAGCPPNSQHATPKRRQSETRGPEDVREKCFRPACSLGRACSGGRGPSPNSSPPSPRRELGAEGRQAGFTRRASIWETGALTSVLTALQTKACGTCLPRTFRGAPRPTPSAWTSSGKE